MDSYEILYALYRIQGLSDPAHGVESDKLDEIYEIASDVMRRTGFQPNPGDD